MNSYRHFIFSTVFFIVKAVLIIASILVITGCKTVQTPSCISDKQKGLIIKWGDYDNEKREFVGHIMKTDTEIFSVKSAGLLGNYDKEASVSVAGDDYCKILNNIRKEFLSTQTLNSPGDISRIIEFNNPATNVVLRAVWNPKFETFGSKGFRKIYSQLQDILQNNK